MSSARTLGNRLKDHQLRALLGLKSVLSSISSQVHGTQAIRPILVERNGTTFETYFLRCQGDSIKHLPAASKRLRGQLCRCPAKEKRCERDFCRLPSLAKLIRRSGYSR